MDNKTKTIEPIEVKTELEQYQKMFIMSMAMGRDLFQHMKEGMEFRFKMNLNTKYKINSIDNRSTKKKKEKAKEFEFKTYQKLIDKNINVMSNLAESVCMQFPELEDKLALKGYEVMENIFPVVK